MAELMELMESWEGYTPVSAKRINEAAAAQLLGLMNNDRRMPRHRWEYELREVITTSDFPDLFGFITEREILAAYRAVVPDWKQYIPSGSLPNFNQAEMHKVQGNNTRLPRVAQKGEYLISPMSDAHYHRQVYKYGRQFDISWEATVNDILDAFNDMPSRFAEAAVQTEAWEATGTYCSAAGPNALLFGGALMDVDGQVINNVGVLPLTVANLQITRGLMALQTDVNGRPLGIRGVHLVVPTSLEIQALTILNSPMVQWTEVGAGAGIPVPTTNIIPQLGIKLHVDPNLEVMDATATADTTWYLFADKSQGKAAQVDFLRGYETPEVCMKASDKVAVGGGALLSPFSGDFATDNVFYRVRHCVGGTQLDPRYAYAQVAP